jgi:carbamoyltransferase
MEKIDNNPRFSELEEVNVVPQILEKYGYTMDDVDRFVIDGWESFVTKNYNGQPLSFDLEQYGTLVVNHDLLSHSTFSNKFCEYNSYMHVTGHVFGAYCTSDFAKRKENSYVLVWDGGMCPQLFYYDCEANKVENLRPLFLINGNVYCEFAQQYEPYKGTGKYDMSVAGKVMAYIAKGTVTPQHLEDFWAVYNAIPLNTPEFTQALVSALVEMGEQKQYASVDMIATFHDFMEQLLVQSLATHVEEHGNKSRNICLSGGCALNIKWNSAVRESDTFDNVWVPPFPNDSGSAAGAACCEMIMSTEHRALEWSFYAGPDVVESELDPSWTKESCSIAQLAELLATQGDPVIFLHGRAEVGPRALGNRSILAPATSPLMKERLNEIKKRESYRPVAPICLIEDAPDVFLPGSPDPLMLFDHQVQKDWLDKIPAVCHLDGSARLQTVREEDNPTIYALLQEYKKLTGVPVLCNTSANQNGKGFFPDVASVVRWGRVNYVWSNHMIYKFKGTDAVKKSAAEEEEYNVISL